MLKHFRNEIHINHTSEAKYFLINWSINCEFRIFENFLYGIFLGFFTKENFCIVIFSRAKLNYIICDYIFRQHFFSWNCFVIDGWKPCAFRERNRMAWGSVVGCFDGMATAITCLCWSTKFFRDLHHWLEQSTFSQTCDDSHVICQPISTQVWHRIPNLTDVMPVQQHAFIDFMYKWPMST